MSIEISLNNLESDWWFDLGISYQKIDFNHVYIRVFSVSVIFFSIYMRCKNKK